LLNRLFLTTPRITIALHLFARIIAGCFILFSLVNTVLAEGSKELTANGGNRAYLFSSTQANPSFPFPTEGTMKVYVKAGETLYVGSSAQGFDAGTIILTSPNGETFTSGTSKTIGLIANRAQEVAGPLPNTGGYTPYKVTATAAQEGVWLVNFISESNGVDFGFNPPAVAANAEWTQPGGRYVTAFDVSVRNTTNTAFLSGRVFTNVFSGILGTFNVGFNAIFNIVTSDGYQYTFNNNGQAGNGFTFFVNNKGFRNVDGMASYQSVNGFAPNVQDPRSDDTPADITQKIFFNPPAADLPALANTPGGGTTWLLKQPLSPQVNDLKFTGVEGTAGRTGTKPLGADITFDATVAGIYTIAIDANNNGVFTDAIDRKITGDAVAGPNVIHWDGLDGLGNKTPASPTAYNSKISLSVRGGEVHFPFFDVERNLNGIILTRINGSYAPDDSLYWDDTPIDKIGTPSNPIKNTTGLSSTVNGHKWGSPAPDPLDPNDFGNNQSIDTWSYISSPPIINTISFTVQEADLEVAGIQAVLDCSNKPAVYTIDVKNNGPSDVTGAKFVFKFPAELTGISVGSASVTGNSSAGAGAVSGNVYSADINLASGAIRTFTVTGTITAQIAGSLAVTAGILRPADVTDPDATNPDNAPPTDVMTECNSASSGDGCNNIKMNVTAFILSPTAGPDQTVVKNETATLNGIGSGTWTQAPGDPAMAIIANPSNPSATITGLTNFGKYHFIYSNANACADTVVITVEASSLAIPNIFTPNNDGRNDVFKISGIESFPGTQLIIFNRWGNEVYRADNYLNNWDGGNLAEGTYYYVVNKKEHNGGVTSYKGWVYIKRTK